MDNPIIQALRRARQAYMTNVGEPTAQLVGGGVRGYLGLDAPEYADSRGMEAYRNAAAIGNTPVVGMPSMAVRAGTRAAPAMARALREQAQGFQEYNRALGPAGASQAIVWHGSPHKFDRFDSSKIGTGEGAQAYGHGLYLAESRGVGADYADVLASPRNRVADRRGVYIEPSPIESGKYMLATKSEIGQPRGMAADATQFLYTDKQFPNIASAVKFARQKGLLSRNERQRLTAIGEDRQYVPVKKAADVAEPEYTQFIASDPGYLYKVDLPDEKIARMLDWDKPLSQQAPEVQAALNRLPPDVKAHIGIGKYDDLKGGIDIVKPLGGLVGDAKVPPMLRQTGIPGIRYLDGGSRGAGQGTSNFVVFPGEEAALTILERNNEIINALRKRKPD